MAIIFKPVERVVFIEAPATEVSVQDLVNAIRDWEDSPEGIVYDQICNAAGKQTIPGGKTGIVLELINNWRLQFEPRPGPDWVKCTVIGGDLTTTNDYGNLPIKPSAYVSDSYAQSSSPTLVYASGGSPEEIADAVADEVLTGHNVPDSLGTILKTRASQAQLSAAALTAEEILDILENRLVINEATSELWLYDDNGLAVIKKWPIKSKSFGPITLEGTGPAHRGARTL